MPVIKAVDLAYGRLRSPDLDKQEEFLTAFGMVRADRTKNALYMRGTDPAHHLHVTELGEPKFVGIAFHAAPPPPCPRSGGAEIRRHRVPRRQHRRFGKTLAQRGRIAGRGDRRA